MFSPRPEMRIELALGLLVLALRFKLVLVASVHSLGLWVRSSAALQQHRHRAKYELTANIRKIE